MSEQQQMYYPEPEQQHDPDPRYINTDPREQRAYGRSSQTQQFGEKVRPRQQARQHRRNVPWWLWLVIILIFASAMNGLGKSVFNRDNGFGGFNDMRDMKMHFSGPAPDMRMAHIDTQEVAAGVTVVITNQNGSVHVHQGGDGQVTLQDDVFGPPDANAVHMNYDKAQNQLVVNVDSPTNVSLDISVPQSANVQLTDNTGNVNIEDVQGQITVNDDSGSIAANNVSGQIQMTTNSGSIDVTGATLDSKSSFRSGSGSISVDGSLDSTGVYQFNSDSGSIDLTLPDNTAFQLNGSAGSGTLSNDFGNASVGSAPRAEVTMNSNSGSITVHKQG